MNFNTILVLALYKNCMSGILNLYSYMQIVKSLSMSGVYDWNMLGLVLVKHHIAILEVISLQMIKANNIITQVEHTTETNIISKWNKYSRPTFSFLNI